MPTPPTDRLSWQRLRRAFVVLVVGGVLVGTAIARTSAGRDRLRRQSDDLLVQRVLGFGAGTQPVVGLLLVASTVLLARWLPRVGPRAADRREGTDLGVVAPPVVVSVERA